ncbi:hypothetical protein M409DRAFT_27035 [Zasmidium cellare ATCC 36951]|uniref:BTB domain-containing protein n=1 Tax=Zasmidium cellare ATCC 36951 TaxID=1080233 RepID=A0A6A6C850_ZASCE|nr:uncharacterized protein M409DRAFT_27035 [Zasmidium cellare ATCC 36951]KAF2162410.1 hypothetical protein M409DRAFT_27035 [Zasmidium cellare ATCC 36951]
MEHGQILRSLRETGEYSDLTVVCGSKTFKVHRCIEGEEGVIELKAVDSYGEDEDFSCDDPDAVSSMVDFIYLGDYGLSPSAAVAATSSTPAAQQTNIFAAPDDEEIAPVEAPPVDWSSVAPPKRNKKKRHVDSFGWGVPQQGFCTEHDPEIGSPTRIPQSKGSLTMHARLYALAVKYNLSDLKKVAIEKMKLAVRGTWDREDFAKAIAVAFGATPDGDRGMRDIIIQTILSCSANLVSDPVVEKAINAVDGLPFELFKLQSTSAKRKGY